jgi:hypothetical protein
MTGWELNTTASALLLGESSQPLQAFVDAYGPLASLCFEQGTLAVLTRFHPTLNCAPDDETNPSDDYSLRIIFYTVSGREACFVPKSLTYEKIELIPNGRAGHYSVDIAITTKEYGVTLTNQYELREKMADNYQPLSEVENLKRYPQLSNMHWDPAPNIPITHTQVLLPGIGTFKQAQFPDWWSMAVEVPLVAATLPITVTDFNPDDPAQVHQTALYAQSLTKFLALDHTAKLAASPLVVKNCHDFLDTVEEMEEDSPMRGIKNPEEIWQYVHPKEVYVSFDTDSGRVYVSLMCECDWEQEHGLQLVYEDGKTLTRVSQQDGHLFDVE